MNFNWIERPRASASVLGLFELLLRRYEDMHEVVGREAWKWLVGQIALAVDTRAVLESDTAQIQPDALDALEVLNQINREFLNSIHQQFIKQGSQQARRRLFISHRQSDAALGERMACIAQEHSFAYWLDIHDPLLNALKTPGIRLTPQVVAILTAAIIEIALINCSHVIALVSQRSSGSMWIPYELGRAKKSGLVWSLEAASWVENGVAPIPEYLHLAPSFRRESEIRNWLGGVPCALPCRSRTQGHSLDKGLI